MRLKLTAAEHETVARQDIRLLDRAAVLGGIIIIYPFSIFDEGAFDTAETPAELMRTRRADKSRTNGDGGC